MENDLMGRLMAAAGQTIADKIASDRSAIDAMKALPAVIVAIVGAMHEPTEAMIDAGFKAGAVHSDRGPGGSGGIWRAMIDAALTPPTNP